MWASANSARFIRVHTHFLKQVLTFNLKITKRNFIAILLIPVFPVSMLSPLTVSAAINWYPYISLVFHTSSISFVCNSSLLISCLPLPLVPSSFGWLSQNPITLLESYCASMEVIMTLSTSRSCP